MKLVKSSLLVKLLILVLVVYATVTLVNLRKQISEKNAEAAKLTSSITAVEQETNRLQDAFDALGTNESAEAIAQEKLDMVHEGGIVFQDAAK